VKNATVAVIAVPPEIGAALIVHTPPVAQHDHVFTMEKDLNNRNRTQQLIKRTGGIPLLMQLIFSDITRFSWDYLGELPQLFGADLLDFLYQQRWAELESLDKVGVLAVPWQGKAWREKRVTAKWQKPCPHCGRAGGMASLATWGQGYALPLRRIPNGFAALDEALKGGIPVGRISAISGRPTSGMTMLAWHILANAGKDAGNLVYLDTGHSFDPATAARCGVPLERLLLIHLQEEGQAIHIMRDFILGGQKQFILFDSCQARLVGPAVAQLVNSSLTLPYFATAVEQRANRRLQGEWLVLGGQRWQARPVYAFCRQVASSDARPGWRYARRAFFRRRPIS